MDLRAPTQVLCWNVQAGVGVDQDTWDQIMEFAPNARGMLLPIPFDPTNQTDILAVFKSTYASLISNLNTIAVEQLRKKLEASGLAPEAAKFLSEYLPCDYMRSLAQYRGGVRSSIMKAELKNLRDASIKLERALKNLSIPTIALVKGELRDECYEGSEENPLLVTEKTFFTFHRSLGTYPCWLPNPETLFALNDLAVAAEASTMKVPLDRGGEVSGHHDSTGATVRRNLAVTIRMNLKRLKKPYGSHKGGAVSEILSLIHEAAFGESADWSDRHAATSIQSEQHYKDLMDREEEEENGRDVSNPGGMKRRQARLAALRAARNSVQPTDLEKPVRIPKGKMESSQ